MHRRYEKDGGRWSIVEVEGTKLQSILQKGTEGAKDLNREVRRMRERETHGTCKKDSGRSSKGEGILQKRTKGTKDMNREIRELREREFVGTASR
jgi:hypothetical protein